MVTQVANNLGVDQSVLRRWVQLERGGAMEMNPAKPLRAEALGEVQSLQRELRRVTMERDILKTALGHFAKDPAVKYAYIARQRSVWSTKVTCRLLVVSPSGFYGRLGRGPSAKSHEDARLTRNIQQRFELSDRTYGSPSAQPGHAVVATPLTG